MPCDTDVSRRIEFTQELSVIEIIIASNSDAIVVFVGDFNIDFTRDTGLTYVFLLISVNDISCILLTRIP